MLNYPNLENEQLLNTYQKCSVFKKINKTLPLSSVCANLSLNFNQFYIS